MNEAHFAPAPKSDLFAWAKEQARQNAQDERDAADLRTRLEAAEPYRVGALLAAGFHGAAGGWRIEIRETIPEFDARSNGSVWVTR